MMLTRRALGESAHPMWRSFFPRLAALAIGGAAVALPGCGGAARSLPTVKSLAITPGTWSAPAGVPATFEAQETLSDGTMRVAIGGVQWQASGAGADGGMAMVKTLAPGVFAGLVPGTITITAAANGQTATATLTVTQAQAVALTLIPPSATVPIGLTVPLTAQAEFTDGSTQDVTAMATWSVDKTAIATVDSTGKVKGVATGSATVTAQFGITAAPAMYMPSATAAITVTPAVVTSVVVAPSAPSAPVGVQQPFTATAKLSDGTSMTVTAAAEWTESDSAMGSIAYVSNAPSAAGVAVGTAPGMATITAAYGGVSGGQPFTVTPAVAQSLAISPPSATVPDGATVQLKATGTFSDGSVRDVTGSVIWSTSDATVATVNAKGLVQGQYTGATMGGATITAAWNSLGTGAGTDAGGPRDGGTIVSATASVTGTPAAIETIGVTCPGCSGGTGTPTAPHVAVGGTIQMQAMANYSNGTMTAYTANATWDSDKTSVATVSDASGSKGLVTGVAAGTANILATVGAVTGSVAVGVP